MTAAKRRRGTDKPFLSTTMSKYGSAPQEVRSSSLTITCICFTRRVPNRLSNLRLASDAPSRPSLAVDDKYKRPKRSGFRSRELERHCSLMLSKGRTLLSNWHQTTYVLSLLTSKLSTVCQYEPTAATYQYCAVSILTIASVHIQDQWIKFRSRPVT